MIFTSLLSVGLPRLVDRLLKSVAVAFLLLLLWCAYKVWVTPVPGAHLPANSSMEPLIVESPIVVDELHIITERPLFWRGRRPLVEEEPVEEVAVDDHSGDLSKLKILGVYSGGAMISGVEDRSRLTIGEEVFGWLLESIFWDELVFTKDGRESRISLEQPAGVSSGMEKVGRLGEKAKQKQ